MAEPSIEAEVTTADRQPATAIVQEILSAIPAGCTWLLPVVIDGQVVDFRIAAVSGHRLDIYGRGVARVDSLLSEIYPTMVNGPLWQLYVDVLSTGKPGHLSDFRYEEQRAGVVAESLFEVSVYRTLGGVLVWWQRLDESLRRLERTELLGNLGWAEYDLATGQSEWSPGMYRIFERDMAMGPMSRAEQSAAVVPEDEGIRETAWQTLDSGASSDVTLRLKLGDSMKHIRVLSDTARDAEGQPVKIYAVVQDVTARESSRTAIERLTDQLRTREITALAEHRLAAQLQNMIQPIPRDSFTLHGLTALVNYLPAESTIQVGGDWYHAQSLADDTVALAIGDVAGHGLEAANGMAHLRFALIAWLSIGLRDPGQLLDHMNGLCRQLRITGTAVVAIYDPTTKHLRWARAGHMPPLLARGGETRELSRPAGLLLGAVDRAPYPVVTSHLRADDLILLYTDGLVERRRGGTAELLAKVKAAMSDASALSGQDTLTELRKKLDYASPDDDTCTVTLRVTA